MKFLPILFGYSHKFRKHHLPILYTVVIQSTFINVLCLQCHHPSLTPPSPHPHPPPSPVTKLFFTFHYSPFATAPSSPSPASLPFLLQMDEADFSSFCRWVEDLPGAETQPYLQGVVRLDVRPCLSFDSAEVLVCTCVYQLCICMYCHVYTQKHAGIPVLTPHTCRCTKVLHMLLYKYMYVYMYVYCTCV